MEKLYLQHNIIISYCSKCGSKLTEDNNDKVKDSHGNSFCDDFCRMDYWTEIRQDMDDVLNEMIGGIHNATDS